MTLTLSPEARAPSCDRGRLCAACVGLRACGRDTGCVLGPRAVAGGSDLRSTESDAFNAAQIPTDRAARLRHRHHRRRDKEASRAVPAALPPGDAETDAGRALRPRRCHSGSRVRNLLRARQRSPAVSRAALQPSRKVPSAARLLCRSQRVPPARPSSRGCAPGAPCTRGVGIARGAEARSGGGVRGQRESSHPAGSRHQDVTAPTYDMVSIAYASGLKRDE